MYRRLHLYKDKLPKRRRKKSDDDEDNLFLKGMYNPFLQTKGYDVEPVGINREDKEIQTDGLRMTNKETQTYENYDDPEIDYQRFPWMIRRIEAEAKDYQTLLDDRRDKAVQTFRYMLRQNDYSPPSSSDPPNKPLSTSSRETPPMSNKSSSNEKEGEAEERSHVNDDLRRLREFFSWGNDVEVGSNRSDESKASLASGKKIDTPPPSSSSSSRASGEASRLAREASAEASSSSVRSGIVLPVESGSSKPETIQSSHSSGRTNQYISSGSSNKSHSSQRTIQHISSGSSNKSHVSVD